MADISDVELRDMCERRLTGLKQNRRSIEADWREVAQYFPPRRGRWLCQNPDQGDRLNSKILNGTGARVSNLLANGMFSGLTSPSRPWFRLAMQEASEVNETADVKAWIDQAQKAISRLFSKTNFYNAIHGGYKELGLFGVEAAIFVADWKKGGVVHQLTAGEYWVGLSATLEPDTLYRRCPMTVGQLVQRFGASVSDTVRGMYDRKQLDQWVPCFHAIEPNPQRIPGMVDRTNMVIRSAYWEEGSPKDKILEFAGFEQQPFWAPRWEVTGSATYGSSPAMDALGDAKQLQLAELRNQQAIDFVVRPPVKAPPQLDSARLVPGGVTHIAASDDSEFKAVYQINPDFPAMNNNIARIEKSMSQHFYGDLWMAISEMEGVQPRNQQEITERVGEKMTQLGPVVERLQNEKLRIAVDIAWSIVRKAGVLPAPPAELRGQQLDPDFISVLAQMQRASGLTAIERGGAFVASMASSHPEVLDKWDADAATDEYMDILSVPPKIIRSDTDVAKIRANRQKQQQAMAAATAAPAAVDASQAALNLSKTEVGGGENALQRMIGA